MHPYYIIRALGGLLFVVGMVLMIYNCWKTVHGCARACDSCACKGKTEASHA